MLLSAFHKVKGERREEKWKADGSDWTRLLWATDVSTEQKRRPARACDLLIIALEIELNTANHQESRHEKDLFRFHARAPTPWFLGIENCAGRAGVGGECSLFLDRSPALRGPLLKMR